MASADNQIREVLKSFGEDFNDKGTVWRVQGTAVISHKALERIAAKAKIRFDNPVVLRCERDEAVILVSGNHGDLREWSIGEALVNVNYRVTGKQAAYVYAMAEKRAKDRVILKLVSLHGLAYSEEEADDFSRRNEDAHLEPARLKPMTVQHMLAEIQACNGDADMLAELKAEETFRLGFRHATKDEQAKILAALNPTEGAAA